MYATLEELKTYLGITTDTDDDMLVDCLEAATAAIERYTGRVFEAEAETRYFDAESDASGRTLWIDDCMEVLTVVNGDGITLDSSYWYPIPRRTPPYFGITLRHNCPYRWTYTDDPADAIAVTARWGYSLTPPDDIRHACLRWAGYMYRQRESQLYDTTAYPEQGIIMTPQGMPKDVAQLLQSYVKIV